MANKTIYTILIVCEGTKSEPNYFKGIAEYIDNNDIWIDDVEITISPKPPLDDEDLTPQATPKHKTKRKKRQLRGVEKEPIPKIEDKYKAAPVRYVREAQQGLEDGTFDEVWAVFDKDGHPKPEEAYLLSEQKIEEKTVNIAFSSISFEHWILLHFEKNNTAFLKSECKEGTGRNKKPIGCGSGVVNDCYGAKCVIGYIKTCQYLDYEKRMNLYASIKDKTLFALENAAWLQHEQSNNSLPIWEQNPYTNIDILVKRLLQIDKKITWMSYNQLLEVENLIITFSKLSNILKLDIQITNNVRFVINEEKIRIRDKNQNNVLNNFQSKMIDGTGNIEIDLTKISGKELILSFDVSSQNALMISI